MRLSYQDISSILQVVDEYTINIEYKLYLYGSRNDDSLKGGDIDLLLVVNSPIQRNKLLKQKFRLLAQLKTLIGDQRIDLSIISECQLAEPFYAMIIKSAKKIEKK